jgi:integrase
VEIRISALRFLYKRVLRRRDFTHDDLIFPKVPVKLPMVLSQEEVARLIDAAPSRLYRMLIVLLYATGLRRTEASLIKVEDIDSKRMVIHIRQGKGARDRDVPLSPKLLEELRSYWRWKSRVDTCFPAPQASAVSISPSLIKPSGTPAGSRPRAPDSPRRFIRTCCAIASRHTYSKPVPTCAPFNC